MSIPLEQHRDRFAARCAEHEANLRNLRDYAEPVFALLHLFGGPEPHSVHVDFTNGGIWQLFIIWDGAALRLKACKDELQCVINSGVLRGPIDQTYHLKRTDVEAVAINLLRFITDVFRDRGAMPAGLAVNPTDADLLRRLLDDTCDEPPPWTRRPLKHVLTDAQRLAVVRQLLGGGET
jgi:hypothetical protein